MATNGTRAREIDLLRFQLDEIDAVAPGRRRGRARCVAEEELLAGALAHRERRRAAVALLDRRRRRRRRRLAHAVHRLDDRSPFDPSVADSARATWPRAGGLRERAPRPGRVDRTRRGAPRRGRRPAPAADRAATQVRRHRRGGRGLPGTRCGERLERADRGRRDPHPARARSSQRALAAELAERVPALGEARRAPRLPGSPTRSRPPRRTWPCPAPSWRSHVDDTAELPGAGEAVEFRFATNAGSPPGQRVQGRLGRRAQPGDAGAATGPLRRPAHDGVRRGRRRHRRLRRRSRSAGRCRTWPATVRCSS